jgi:hypothetical protein
MAGRMGIERVRPGDALEPEKHSRFEQVSKHSYAPAPTVGWYDPRQLATTGIAVAISTLFGRHADRRMLEALDAAPLDYFDYSVDDAGRPRPELWLDYVADTGDGFDATYAVASAVASDLELEAPDGEIHATRRGRVLVFGGDLVYPVASRRQYEQRMVMPYEQALPHSDAPHPDIFAIPGNHDWYDGLIAFTRRFCSGRWIGGWRTHQRTSYFALQLPHDWWLLGTDVQLDSDIDDEQVKYFKAVAAKMPKTARIILCNAEPHWIYQRTKGDPDGHALDSNLRFLENSVFQRPISVFLAGDLHHYRRHCNGADCHKIVAGGGGAFLHPTHDADVEVLPDDYAQRAAYPDPATSRALTRRNLLFPLLNWRFGVLTAVLYLLTCRAVQVDLSGYGLGQIAAAVHDVLVAIVETRAAGAQLALLIGGVILFTDLGSMRHRLASGLAHALAHLLAVFFIGWTASWLFGHGALPEIWRTIATGALIFAAGWIAGSVVMGLYLFLSLNCLGRHANEAFSSLAIVDWKNFLRLHVDAAGTLRIYPVGIDRVPRRWRKACPGEAGPRRVADDPRATPPRLIEPPIAVPGGRAKRRP